MPRVTELLVLAASNINGTAVSLLSASYSFGFSRRTFHAAIRWRNSEERIRYGRDGREPVWPDLTAEAKSSLLMDAAARSWPR